MSSLPATPEHDVDDHTSPRKRGLARRVTGAIVTALALVFLLLPAALFLAAGIWAIGAYGYSLSRLWSAASNGRLDQLGIRLDALSLAGHTMLASIGYFALVLALSVLVVGILGRERRYFLIASGLVLAIPSMLGLSFGLQTALATLSATLRISAGYFTLVWVALSMYVLADAVLLGMLLADARPQRGRIQRTSRPAADMLDSGPIAPMQISLAPEDVVPDRERLSEEEGEPVTPAATGTVVALEQSSPDAPSATTTTEVEPPAGEDCVI